MYMDKCRFAFAVSVVCFIHSLQSVRVCIVISVEQMKIKLFVKTVIVCYVSYILFLHRLSLQLIN